MDIFPYSLGDYVQCLLGTGKIIGYHWGVETNNWKVQIKFSSPGQYLEKAWFDIDSVRLSTTLEILLYG